MSGGQIQDLLITQALSMAIGSPALPVVMQGLSQIPLAGDYVELQFVPDDAENVFVGNNAASSYTGFLQASVMYEAGTGTVGAGYVADEIVDAWPKGMTLYGTGFKVKVNRKPFQRQPIKDGKWWRLPVIIPYRAIAR